VSGKHSLNESAGRDRTLFGHEGERPGEDVHEVGQPVRVGRVIELANVHHCVFVPHHRTMIAITLSVSETYRADQTRGTRKRYPLLP
jgi:hypothetical protein